MAFSHFYVFEIVFEINSFIQFILSFGLDAWLRLLKLYSKTPLCPDWTPATAASTDWWSRSLTHTLWPSHYQISHHHLCRHNLLQPFCRKNDSKVSSFRMQKKCKKPSCKKCARLVTRRCSVTGSSLPGSKNQFAERTFPLLACSYILQEETFLLCGGEGGEKKKQKHAWPCHCFVCAMGVCLCVHAWVHAW